MSSNRKESVALDNDIIIKLRQCRSKKLLNKIFIEHSINSTQQKFSYLESAMQQTALYYAGRSGETDLEDLYQDTESIFLHGAWRAFS